jgi:hypothetical protein
MASLPLPKKSAQASFAKITGFYCALQKKKKSLLLGRLFQ